MRDGFASLRGGVTSERPVSSNRGSVYATHVCITKHIIDRSLRDNCGRITACWLKLPIGCRRRLRRWLSPERESARKAEFPISVLLVGFGRHLSRSISTTSSPAPMPAANTGASSRLPIEILPMLSQISGTESLPDGSNPDVSRRSSPRTLMAFIRSPVADRFASYTARRDPLSAWTAPNGFPTSRVLLTSFWRRTNRRRVRIVAAS